MGTQLLLFGSGSLNFLYAGKDCNCTRTRGDELRYDQSDAGCGNWRTMDPSHVQIDRNRYNQTFQSWRLSHGVPDASHKSMKLPGNVYVARSEGYDYLHTRMSLLENHLKADLHALYTILEGQDTVQLARTGGSGASCRILLGKVLT